MTLKQFKKHLTKLCEYKKEQERIEAILNKSPLNDSFYQQIFAVSRYETLIVEMLTDIFDDKADWIGYWLYELEMGTTYKNGCIKDNKGKIVKAKTIEDLYKLLCQ